MKTNITLIILALTVIALWMHVSNRYTDALMGMCADTDTETLYKCE